MLVARQLGDTLNGVARQCEEFGVKVLPLLADMSKHEEVNHVVKLALDRFSKVDVLVSATGLRQHNLLWEVSYEEWHQVFASNLYSTFYLAKALAPGMIERKSGSIIALGGLASFVPQKNSAALVASKHGLHGLIKSLALDLGPYGVRANLLALSHIENERINPEWKKGAERPIATPLGRKGKPEEVANVALFLASDESSYVTGDRICCGGGRYM